MNPGTQLKASKRTIWRRHPVILVIVLIFLTLALDAFFIEPYNIQVTHYALEAGSAGLKTPLKIADLSDLHTRGLGRRERKMLAVLAAEKPDVILITGDTLADPFGNYADALEVYKQLHAPLGVWFVLGNWENWQPVRRERQFYAEAGVHLLVNQSHALRPDVWLIGLDDAYTGRPNLDAAMKDVPANVYKIVMFHSPEFYDRPGVAGRANLFLSGHTHGGQVHIPFVKPFWLPRGSGRFLEGWYQQDGSQMYVSRGLGMSEIPVRFLCRPEITFITLTP
jgi:uncharacterized protein